MHWISVASVLVKEGTHHHHAARPDHRQDSIVRARPARRGVHEDVDVLVHRAPEVLRREELVNVLLAEGLFQCFKGQATQFAFYEVRAIRHDVLQPHVLRRALPRRHDVQHVCVCAWREGCL